MTKTHLYATILAGGSGQRFWPLSRELNPKQLLSMFGTESLIAAAVHRILPFAEGGSSVVVATNERLFDELRNHLTAQDDPELHAVRYIQEPLPKNTAPAIALGRRHLRQPRTPTRSWWCCPAITCLRTATCGPTASTRPPRVAADGYLVTIGIAPSRPETGYGYIRAAEAIPQFTVGSAMPHVVAEFIEKPDAPRAEQFVASGEYYWNAGIFVMRAAQVLEELDRAGGAEANIADAARWIASQPAENRNGAEARERFAALESLSIDTAVMERSDRVAVIPASLKWSDVGSLLALADIAEPDARGQRARGPRRGHRLGQQHRLLGRPPGGDARCRGSHRRRHNRRHTRAAQGHARRTCDRWSMRSRRLAHLRSLSLRSVSAHGAPGRACSLGPTTRSRSSRSSRAAGRACSAIGIGASTGSSWPVPLSVTRDDEILRGSRQRERVRSARCPSPNREPAARACCRSSRCR